MAKRTYGQFVHLGSDPRRRGFSGVCFQDEVVIVVLTWKPTRGMTFSSHFKDKSGFQEFSLQFLVAHDEKGSPQERLGRKMSIEAFASSKFGQLFIRVIAAVMESRFRYRFFDPLHVLQDAAIYPGQTVLELGCGTGFFTIPIARLLSGQGSLIAMDVLPESVETVSKKVQAAHLENVRVLKGDALNTQLGPESIDTVLVFGIIPAPMLPVDRLLLEMHRILRPGGIIAIWPPSWVLRSVPKSGLFTFVSKRHGVFNFKRS